MLRAVHTDRTHTLDVCTRAELRTALHKQATGHGIDYRKFPLDIALEVFSLTFICPDGLSFRKVPTKLLQQSFLLSTQIPPVMSDGLIM